MAKKALPVQSGDEDGGQTDDFDNLMHRFLMATERLQLADNTFRNMGVYKEYGPIAAVVEEVTEALEKLHRDFEHWDMNHHHTPKVKEAQS